jgi:hypothetical protein
MQEPKHRKLTRERSADDVKKVEEDISSEPRAPGWEVIREGDSGVLKCKGRIPGYQPMYVEGGDFREIDHAYTQ